jgi:6-phosphogluconolactonase (cycloisomerase 2 family)
MRGESKSRRFHLSGYTASGGRGIGTGTVDTATGALTVESWFDGVAEPSWSDRSPDGTVLYATSELFPDGLVHALRLDDNGVPTALNRQRTGAGPAHVQVHPGGAYLFTSLYGGGAVVTHPILPDGTVGPASDVRRHGTGSHAHQVVVDPSGRWLLAADLGLDRVYVYQLDVEAGRLREAGRTALAAGAGPRHLAFHPGGGHAYVANELDSTVTVCSWQDGVLTPDRTLPTVLASPPTRNHPAEVLVSPDGRFVYVANRGDNSVAVFTVDDDGAALTLRATPTCGGDWPRHLAIDPSGHWLYAVNQRSNDVVWFGIDPESGVPGDAAGRLAVTAPAHLLFS